MMKSVETDSDIDWAIVDFLRRTILSIQNIKIQSLSRANMAHGIGRIEILEQKPTF